MTSPKPNNYSEIKRRFVGLIGLLLVVAALAWWIGSGFYTVESNQKGVVLRFGKIHAIEQPGMHFALPWPIDKIYTPRTTEVKRIEVGWTTLGQLSSEPRRSDALTGDINILKVKMVVQYRIRSPQDYLFATEQPDWLVERTVESAMNDLIASMAVDDVLTVGKSTIQVEAIRAAQAQLDDYGAGIVLLGGNLQTVREPVPVANAFKEVASAKKDAERMIDEARAHNSRIIPQARGEGQRIVSRAEGQYAQRVNEAHGEAARFLSLLAEYHKAKWITRTRLYLETLQAVMGQMNAVILEPPTDGQPIHVTIVDR